VGTKEGDSRPIAAVEESSPEKMKSFKSQGQFDKGVDAMDHKHVFQIEDQDRSIDAHYNIGGDEIQGIHQVDSPLRRDDGDIGGDGIAASFHKESPS
jgi:hypothetical protein